nr:HepT-like ribonuclease domain-containing protein [Mycolicibacter icosiumassiliensis]
MLREIGIIGEAVNALPDDITAKRPEIAWRQIAAMRNFLVHEYFNIDQTIIEDVITNDLDPLSTAVTMLLDITEEGDQSGPDASEVLIESAAHDLAGCGVFGGGVGVQPPAQLSGQSYGACRAGTPASLTDRAAHPQRRSHL